MQNCSLSQARALEGSCSRLQARVGNSLDAQALDNTGSIEVPVHRFMVRALFAPGQRVLVRKADDFVPGVYAKMECRWLSMVCGACLQALETYGLHLAASRATASTKKGAKTRRSLRHRQWLSLSS